MSYSSKTVKELKKLLTERGLDTTGKKAVLVSRLEDFEEQGSESEQDEPFVGTSASPAAASPATASPAASPAPSDSANSTYSEAPSVKSNLTEPLSPSAPSDKSVADISNDITGDVAGSPLAIPTGDDVEDTGVDKSDNLLGDDANQVNLSPAGTDKGSVKLDLGEEDLDFSPLLKQKYRNKSDIPTPPLFPAPVYKGEYTEGLPDEELDQLTDAMENLGLESPAKKIEYTSKNKVYDIRNTNLFSHKRSCPLYQLAEMAPNTKQSNCYYSAIFLRPKEDFDKYDVLASLDETNDSDGSIMCLGLLGAASNFEKSTKLPKPFKLCDPSGHALLDASPDLPRLDTSPEELPIVSSTPMRKWVKINSPSEKIMTGMLSQCLDIEPIDKIAEKYEPALFLYINSNEDTMDTDEVSGDCLLCTFEGDELVLYDKSDYLFEKLTVKDLYSKYGSDFSCSLLLYSSETLPPGPFYLSSEDLVFEDINLTQSTDIKRKRSLITALSAKKKPKKGKTKKKKKPKKEKTKKKKKPKSKTKSKPTKTALGKLFGTNSH